MISQDELLLIEKYIDGTLSDVEFEALRTLLLQSKPAREKLRTLATIDFGLQDIASCEQLNEQQERLIPSQHIQNAIATSGKLPHYAVVLLAVAATLVVALGTALYFQQQRMNAGFAQSESKTDADILTVRSLAGGVLWTGDGGRVTSALKVGQTLSGGTIEGLAPGSWIELQFNDGSNIVVSGNSMLTISDDGQKRLHLKNGSLSADVSPQPHAKPMLVHTRTAVVSVIGTQFKLESDPTATLLNVNEGKVSVERLNDGRIVEVSANERVLASPDSDLNPESIPDSVGHWSSQLELGPAGTVGRWTPPSEGRPPALKTIPFIHTNSNGQKVALTVAAINVTSGDQPPVIVDQEAVIKFNGKFDEADWIVLGVTVLDREGGFGGNFFSIVDLQQTQRDNENQITLEFNQLELDPDLKKKQDELLKNPSDGIIQAVFCSTDANVTGLEVYSVEIGNNLNEEKQ